MSYILEALKKSQQERELGRVPTLETTGTFDEDKVVPARSHWPILAVALAAVAMVVALYAALREPSPAPSTAPAVGLDAASGPVEGFAAGAGSGGGDSPVAARPATERTDTPPVRTETKPAVAGRQERSGATASSPPLPAPKGPATAAAHTSKPLIEPPPPRRAESTRPLGAVEERADFGGVHHPGPGATDRLDFEAEMELHRQMEADYSESLGEEEYADPAPTPVPRDLIADIESFKRQVGGGSRAKKGVAESPPAVIETNPESLRLTAAEEAALPSFLMTVHVFDADQTRRFVMINGRKYREGDKTREDLTVERILAQGAVLSHKGNPFFVPR